MATRIDYYEYIKSPEWKRKATEAKERAGWRCQVCNKSSREIRLDAHHRTYENLGNERPEDITVLCAECHALFSEHQKLAKASVRVFAVKMPVVDVPSVIASGKKLLRLILRPTGNSVIDELRTRRLHGIVTSYAGDDIVVFDVYKNGHRLTSGTRATTAINDELVQRLSALVSPENVIMGGHDE